MNRDEAPLQEIFFRISGTGSGNWEIGRPQSVIIKLVEKGIFRGNLLDIGCGIGDNGIYIAKNVTDVNITSIDMVPKAIEVARMKAKKANVNIRYDIVNILDDLSQTNILPAQSYDIILDAGLFQVFSNEDRLLVMKNLEYLIKPNGLYIQLCFSEKEIRPGGPRRIKKADLEELFSSKNGWTIQSIEDVIYETNSTTTIGSDGQGYLSFIQRNKTT